MSVASLPRPVGRQREVLYLPGQGHTVVLGTAGSGKTTLAILRSLHLADPSTPHSGRTLLVTFNRCLVTYMEHLAGTVRGSVDVCNYHRFARGYLSSRNKMPWSSICAPHERLQFIGDAVIAARNAGVRSATLDRQREFFDEEFQWIQRHGIVDEQDYVAVERTGRSARVTKAERPHVFALYQHYLDQRGKAGKWYDWDDLASAVRAELRDDGRDRLYRNVVIDEGQDFSPEMLRSLAAAIPADGSLTFFGDIAQQIYGYRMSWRSAGLQARRRIWRFKDNYRNTKQIARLALALAAMRHFPDDPDLVEPTAPAADGPPPVLARQPSESEERQLLVSRATDLARTGTVAILFRTRSQEATVQPNLPREATRLHRNLRAWPTGPGLFYGTYHAAKGLEFDTVFMPFLSSEHWPHPPDVEVLGREESVIRDSRLLYVGITRAKSTLVLTYTGRPTALLPTTSGLYQ